MIFTLTKNPIEYYSNIRNHMTNCYLAEDVYQIIIGIDCDYVDSNSYSYDDLQKFYYSSKEHSNAPFAGLFGVFAYETIHYFENINEIIHKIIITILNIKLSFFFLITFISMLLI